MGGWRREADLIFMQRSQAQWATLTISIASLWPPEWHIAMAAPVQNSFGNGTNNGPVIDAEHDLLKALERWVEQGVAPDKIIATKYFDDDPKKGVAFQRPLCP
jgi:hypothetical protein